MAAYYNEIDPFAVRWLRNLIAAGHIAEGEVDDRSIVDVQPSDLRGFDQCHFFAGIGGWAHALRNAGWPDQLPVWTGSCPCQSFSQSGHRGGFDDPRHLWPAWFRLIRECRPSTIFGEQVASNDGLAWFDIVSSDLENTDYAIGAADLCAAGFGAPHIRQRLYFVADSGSERKHALLQREGRGWKLQDCAEVDGRGKAGVLADTELHGLPAIREPGGTEEEGRLLESEGRGAAGDLADAEGEGREGSRVSRRSALNGFWADAEWLPCRDGKTRPVEPGTFPLAHGVPARVGRLRGFGNAINAEVAKGFIEAYLDCV